MRSSQRVVVGCRVRPLLSPSDDGKEVCIAPYHQNRKPPLSGNSRASSSSSASCSPPFQQQQQNENGVDEEAKTKTTMNSFTSLIFDTKKKFSFDEVFFPDDSAPDSSPSSPAGIFSSMVVPLIDAVTINSYNAALLLYGQTGAGKSHTLSSLVHPVILTLIQRMGVENLMFRMIEIQNDNLRDLLAPAPTAENPGEKLTLRDTGSNSNNNNNTNNNTNNNNNTGGTGGGGGGVQLSGATVAVIESEDDAIWLFQEAFRRRATAATGMNASSSRSHAIFSVFCTFPDGRVTQLDLVDLAGSERQKKTQNSGKRMKESVSINSDLLALGNVLRAVAANQQHVPYRQCKLTRLLQGSIGGSAVTTFLACVSPLSYNKDESMRTLQYSAVASMVLNTPIAVQPPPPPPPKPVVVAVDHPHPSQQLDQEKKEEENGSSSSSPISKEDLMLYDGQNHQHHQQQTCKQCQVLSAALDKSENYAFKLENQIDEMNSTLTIAQSDLKKDEKIFVMKFREAKQLQIENEALKKRVAELEETVKKMKTNNTTNVVLPLSLSPKNVSSTTKMFVPTLSCASARNIQPDVIPAATMTSSRFASAHVRGPCFSYEFENNKGDDDDEEEEVENNQQIEHKQEQGEIFLQKMSEEARKIVLASINSGSEGASPVDGWRQILKMKSFQEKEQTSEREIPSSTSKVLGLKQKSGLESNKANSTNSQQQQQQQHQPKQQTKKTKEHKTETKNEDENEQDGEDGPIYSLSPSPKERGSCLDQKTGMMITQVDDGMSKTFVSSAVMSEGSRHLDFNTTSILQNHHQ